MKYLKNRKEAVLLSAFPGTGKSYLYENNEGLTILDSDSSTFDKEGFPQNYIEHIKENLNKAHIIMISSHEEVREALLENDLYFVVAYPSIDLKDEYIERYKNRGNEDSFVELLNNNWENWITEIESDDRFKKIKLSEGEFLSDKIDIG